MRNLKSIPMVLVDVLLAAILLAISAVVSVHIVERLGSGVNIRVYAWRVLLLALSGIFLLAWRREAPGARALAALLASLSTMFGDYPNTEWVPDWGHAPAHLWEHSLRALFPFVFIHFSLVFPNTSLFVQRRRKLILSILYGAYIALAVALAAEAMDWLAFPYPIRELSLQLLVVGFLAGLVIFLRNYFYSLTETEKNRLRVVLVGCLAGALPLLLSPLTAEDTLVRAALVLLPLFPAALFVAVFKQSFAVIGPTVQKGLIVSLVCAGFVSGFFASYGFLAVTLDLRRSTLAWISLIVAVALLYPLTRWAGSYVGAHFASSAVLRQVEWTRPSGKFESISPNPYIVGNPVRDPKMFFGRTQDFEFIRKKLDIQRDGCVIVLCGERRAGKTSVLYQVMNGRLGRNFAPVFIDMQELVVQDDAGLVSSLAQKVSDGVQSRLASPLRLAPQAVTDYSKLSQIFDEVARGLGANRLLLLFDEYELLSDKIRDSKISAHIYTYLNALLEHYPNISMLFAGSRPLEADEAAHPLLGKSSYREISFLAPVDAQRLICAPLEGRACFQPEAVLQILILTRGHPFFTQLICQSLVDVLNDSRTDCVTPACVEEVSRRVLESPPPQLVYQWGALAQTERLILATCAAVVKQPGGYAATERIEKTIASLPVEYRKGLDPVVVRMTLEALRRRRMLDRDQNRYRFAMDLVRLFVRAEHSVWDVLGEPKAAPVGAAGVVSEPEA